MDKIVFHRRQNASARSQSPQILDPAHGLPSFVPDPTFDPSQQKLLKSGTVLHRATRSIAII